MLRRDHTDMGLQSQRELPIQLRLAQEPLEASLILGSFGSAAGSVIPLFDVNVQLDPNSAAPVYEAPLRYAKSAEIKHTFRADPKSPPEIVSIAFALAVLGSIPPFIAAVSSSATADIGDWSQG